jgi:hypothetical protein
MLNDPILDMQIDIPKEILQYAKTYTETKKDRKSLSPVKVPKTPKVVKDAK